MWKRWVRWLRARPLWVAGAGGALGVLVLLYALPLVLVSERGLGNAARLKAENDLRATLVQMVGGGILLFGTAWTLHLNREGQITERFTRAIDQLGQTGDEKLDVRLGGIYALERIGRDSRPDRGPIVEVLTASLREHSQRSNPPDTASDAGRPEQPRLRADFQAVATVLGRSGWSGTHRFDLRHVALRNADLADAHLEGANLFDAHLEGAFLVQAHLEGANLFDAHLEGAVLLDAHLEGAFLVQAHLEGADLAGAHLEGADLTGTHLEGANLFGTHLEGANLFGAHLEGANLAGAHLEGADLTDAHLEGAFGL
jgi:uncharacterized protein YjbI with pentapeptide repeats